MLGRLVQLGYVRRVTLLLSGLLVVSSLSEFGFQLQCLHLRINIASLCDLTEYRKLSHDDAVVMQIHPWHAGLCEHSLLWIRERDQSRAILHRSMHHLALCDGYAYRTTWLTSYCNIEILLCLCEMLPISPKTHQ